MDGIDGGESASEFSSNHFLSSCFVVGRIFSEILWVCGLRVTTVITHFLPSACLSAYDALCLSVCSYVMCFMTLVCTVQIKLILDNDLSNSRYSELVRLNIIFFDIMLSWGASIKLY